MWDHSHINNDTHRLPHIRPYIFTPLHQPQTPVFAKNCHPKSQCHTVQVSRILEFFTQRPLIGWNLRKRYPNAAYFVMAFVTERPPIFCLAYTCLFEGNVASNTVRSWKICILETESSNLGNTFRCKFNKGDENKISFLQARPTQLCIIYGWISLEDRDDTGYYPPIQTRKGIYPTNTLYKSAPLAL